MARKNKYNDDYYRDRYPECRDGRVYRNVRGCWCYRCSTCNKEIVYRSAKIGSVINVLHNGARCLDCYNKAKIGKKRKPYIRQPEPAPLVIGETKTIYVPSDADTQLLIPVEFIVRKIKCKRCGKSLVRKMPSRWKTCSCYNCWNEIEIVKAKNK